MTDRQYTIRAAQIKGIALVMPTKGCKVILGMKYENDFCKVVVESTDWATARKQINTI